VRYEFHYIKHQSARLDLGSLLDTASSLSARESALQAHAPEPTFGALEGETMTAHCLLPAAALLDAAAPRQTGGERGR
jgi:hypothetical protein